MKKTSNANTENNSPDTLPTREQLATLAVASQRKDPADAVRYALAVWREAGTARREAAAAQASFPAADDANRTGELN